MISAFFLCVCDREAPIQHIKLCKHWTEFVMDGIHTHTHTFIAHRSILNSTLLLIKKVQLIICTLNFIV